MWTRIQENEGKLFHNLPAYFLNDSTFKLFYAKKSLME